jgi:NCS1 family nucleobase:cation symporter-1
LGGYITGVIGILIFPWKLIADPNGYIFTWLIAYSSLLGPVGGIMIADYYFIRRKTLIADDLYSHKGAYAYTNGFNYVAIIALLLGVIPNIPGFLIAIYAIEKNAVPEIIGQLYNYAWFVGFGVSFGVYVLFSRKVSKTQ